jgi:hypothetical protein
MPLEKFIQPHENTFILIDLNDIIIFSNSLDDHIQHLDNALSLLASHDILYRLQKYFSRATNLNTSVI